MRISERAITIARQCQIDTELGQQEEFWLKDLIHRGGNPCDWRLEEPYAMAALISVFGQAMIQSGDPAKSMNGVPNFPFGVSVRALECYVLARRAGWTSASIQVGDIAVFQMGSTTQGHAGLVTNVLKADNKITGIQTLDFQAYSNQAPLRGMGPVSPGIQEGCFQHTRLLKNFEQTSERRLWIKGWIKTSAL